MMHQRLFEAARLGDIEELHSIVKDDKTSLHQLNMSLNLDTPLHVATLMEQSDFVREITRLRPSLAREANKDGQIPLHMACAIGNLGIALEFLDLGHELCFVKDKGGRTSLHYAALRGRVAVIRELIFRCPQAAKEVTAQGDTALHLAVKHGHCSAFKAMLDGLGDNADELLQTNDGFGQTVSQLALDTKQVQVERLLNSKNDVEDAEEKQGPDEERAIVEEERSTTYESTLRSTRVGEERPEERFFKNMAVGLDRMVPVVAGLITSITFVAVLSPPQSVWKEDMKIDWKCFRYIGFQKSTPFENMLHPTASCPAIMFVTFTSFNTAGFISAVSIIILHPNPRIAPILLFTSLIFLTLTYLTLTVSISPNILTFLATYGATILAFLLVLIYVVMLKSVFKYLLRRLIKAINKFRQATPGAPKWKALIFC